MMHRKGGLLTLAGLALALCLTTGLAQAQVINEVRTDNTGTDTDEYFELKGTPSASLVGLHYLVIGDAASTTCGTVEAVVDLGALTPNTIQADGYFAACRNAAPSLSGYDVTNVTGLNFENSDNVTHMIVTGWSGTLNMDVDTNDDGVFDVTPWTTIVDCIGLVGPNPIACATGQEYTYCATNLGPDGAFWPGHVYRCGDTNVWTMGQFALPPQGLDTPGAANPNCAAAAPTITVERRNLCAPAVSQAVTVTDSIPGATSATLNYSINGGANNVINMTNVGNLWSGTIPGQAVNGTRITYYVVGTNANGDDTGFTWGYFVGTVTVASLRSNDGAGSNIYRFYGARINGVVTSDNFSLSGNTDFYVQDATGGINIFQSGLHPSLPARSNDVTVCGVVAQFNGNLELTTSSSVPTGIEIDVNGPGSLPAPQLLTTCQIDESKEGLLVKLVYLNADTSGATIAGTWRGNDTSGITNCPPPAPLPITLFVDDATNIDGTVVQSLVFDATGICLQNDGATPFDANYRVAPRDLADINYYLGTSGTPVQGGVARLLPLAPNPFRTKATIRFEIPKASSPSGLTPVRISVYDLQGKLVTRLVDDSRTAGTHDVTLTADDLGGASSGIFFYALEVDGRQVSTQKIVLNR